MSEQPKRRWFRFRLSTVLILTAIVAWGMAYAPIDYEKHSAAVGYPNAHVAAIFVFGIANASKETWWTVTIEPSKLLYPVLALAAFLAWKAVWGMVERRRRKASVE